ncbi:hypothetical protein [Dyadobacter sp. NIV53]|uniref:hypothetical protein n=1 Tax=Dyadobacter sp. NIV53 TaxID=2861765 RepID=UPI001C875FA4|nr:hypothetical protein [Dyadobacter sp. NIV53]
MDLNVKKGKNTYLKLFLKFAVLVVLIYLLDIVVGAGVKRLYFKPTEGKFHDQTYAFDSTKADVLIVGSSKAAHNYVSQDIEDSLHVSTYNAGHEGAHFLHQYALLKSVLKRYHPKVIIWDYYNGIKHDPVTYYELSVILPYYETHPEIRPIIDMRSQFEKFKMISKIYPYNSTLVYNANKLLGLYKNPEKDKSVKGYIPLRSKWKDEIKMESKNLEPPLDTTCIAAYKSIIRYCKSNDIQLIMVNSPVYKTFKRTPNYDKLAMEIADQEDIAFLEFTKDSTFIKNPQYFNEPAHLNVEGAKIFTNKLIAEIRKENIL